MGILSGLKAVNSEHFRFDNYKILFNIIRMDANNDLSLYVVGHF